MTFDRLKIAFGEHEEKSDSITNFTILMAKHYIWKNKFGDTPSPLSIVAFKKIFKNKLDDWINLHQLKGTMHIFNQWNEIYDIL